MPQPSARDRFLALLQTAIRDESLVKLTLGKHRGADGSLKNIFVRPVVLKSGRQLSFVYRHATRDLTRNHSPAEALVQLESLIGGDFLDAHLFTPAQTAQLECGADGASRLSLQTASAAPMPAPAGHDRQRDYFVPAESSWLRALGVTNDRAQPREGMAPKFRQINKFVELVTHLVDQAGLPDGRPFRLVDMGSGKGYLTFAAAAYFGARAVVQGIEARPELVDLCNTVARAEALPNLSFIAGSIDHSGPLETDVLVALHACDTATDDAIAKGISAGAALIVVSPCCQKELRSQLTAPAVLAGALKHGIFQERQAEFVTDALRAQLLEWAGYRTKVFEFVSTEHTAKNLLIAATKAHPRGDAATLARLQAFAQFYGIRKQRLAEHLSVTL
jgi:hypothetical protein